MVQASVIVPAFNAAEYIEAAIASATQQQGCELEVIVVDDRSTDDTRERVRRMACADPRVTLLALPLTSVAERVRV